MNRLKKLIIQVPCYNEEQTIGITLKDLPRKVEGFDKVEWLIIDDGSQDNTISAAKEFGADHIVSFNKNQGLAKAFMSGLEASLKLGADVIVNTDADNQYNAQDIPALVKPILENRADMVIGIRPINTIKHFSPLKKFLQRFGSWVVRVVSKTEIIDAPSGFRAISRDAAIHINVFNDYTYTLETIIQAGQKNMLVMCVPVRTNKYLRPSRLLKGLLAYVKRSFFTILRIFVVYKPFRFFLSIGLTIFTAGLLLCLRYVVFLMLGDKRAHIQSLILASILLGMGFQTILMAFLSDLMAVNRKLIEDVQYRLKKAEFDRTK